MNYNKVAIIGAGPAGIACAVQLKRFGIEPLLFERNQVGGLLRNANLVENYLGFESGISGLDLVKKFEQNLDNLNINPIFSEVKKVSFLEGKFCIETDEKSYLSELLVVASGTKPKIPEIFIPDNLKNKIFYEISELNNNNFTGKKFVIIGAGDAAFDYSINLVNNYNASEVVILNRNNKAKCLPLLEKRADEISKILHLKNIKVNSLEEKDGNAVIYCVENEEKSCLIADYIIFAIGRDPIKEFFDEDLLVDSLSLQKDGLFYFIGDVSNGAFRQTSIASGDGIKAAMKIYDYNCLNL